MKITAYLYYSFAVIFLLARIFQNIGGDLIFLAHIMGLFFLAWLILIVYGLFKYRKLPLLILFLIPFINYFIFPYTEKAIFYNIQLPHYQKAINDHQKDRL